MPPGGDITGGISKETFLCAKDSKNRDAMLYDMLQSIDSKVCKLQKRKNRDTAISAGTGFLGGFVAMVTKLAIWKQ